jgi:hypothetical protein
MRRRRQTAAVRAQSAQRQQPRGVAEVSAIIKNRRVGFANADALINDLKNWSVWQWLN